MTSFPTPAFRPREPPLLTCIARSRTAIRPSHRHHPARQVGHALNAPVRLRGERLADVLVQLAHDDDRELDGGREQALGNHREVVGMLQKRGDAFIPMTPRIIMRKAVALHV